MVKLISGTLEILFSALDSLFLTKDRQLVQVIKYGCEEQGGVIHIVLGIRGVFNSFRNPRHGLWTVIMYIIYPQYAFIREWYVGVETDRKLNVAELQLNPFHIKPQN